MELARLLPLVLQASIAAIVASIAMDARVRDLSGLWKKPGLLLRSLLAMFVVMPVVAVGIAVLFDLEHMVEVALIALALSPVPPMLPRKAAKAGSASSSMLGLLFAASVLS